jgi:hypothetical protein
MSRPPGEVALPAGADPALVVPRPNVEEHVHSILRPLGGIQVWAYAVQDLDPAGWLVAASIQVDVRASSATASYRRADQARRVVCSLPLFPWAEGQVNRVDVVDGPFWLPDPDGRPRYVARYRLVFHPVAARTPADPEPAGARRTR